MNPGSLFPALHRLEQKGWLTAEWGRSETNRKAKFYELTSAGRRHTEEEARNWKRISVAIELALRRVRLFCVGGPEGSRRGCERHGKSYLTRRRRGKEGDGGGSLTGGAIPSA